MSEQKQYDLNTREGCMDALLQQLRIVAALTAERDALSATLRQGAESDADLRKRYEALKLERDTERGLRESSEQENDRLRTEREGLKAQVARLSAPVSMMEIPVGERIGAVQFDHIITARTAPAKETKCPKCGGIEKVQAGDMAIHECDRCYHCWDATAPAKP